MSFQDDLIRFYASDSIEALKNLQAFRDLCAANEHDPVFREALNNVKEAKIFVEMFLDQSNPPLTLREKVAAAIRLLVSLRDDRTNLDLCHALVAAGYRPNW